MSDIDRNQLCPDQIEGLEEWDYGSDANMNVTISDRKILLREQVTVNHLVINGTGMLVYGEPKAQTKPTLGPKKIIGTIEGQVQTKSLFIKLKITAFELGKSQFEVSCRTSGKIYHC